MKRPDMIPDDAPTAPRQPRKQRAGAPAPTGASAPTSPPSAVNPALQRSMELVKPAPGYILARLFTAEERAASGLPADTIAHIAAAMLLLLAFNTGDDVLQREYPAGSLVFASLEGIAPLLDTTVFLMPAERIQGAVTHLGVTGSPTEPVGFQPA